MSRLSQAVGESFESWVDGQHDMARQLGIIAHVEKNEPHSKVINGRLIFTAAGVADRTGTLEGGRTLAVECKSTSHGRFLKKEVTKKQQDHLGTVARAGALALLLVEFRSTVAPFYARFAIPWLEVPWTVAISAEGIAAKDLIKWQIAPGTCYLLKYHAGGPRSSGGGVRHRVFARE